MQADPSHTSSAPVAARSVVGLWRYPVKSMMGEELNAAEVTEGGLVGDRRFAVVDPTTGKVAGTAAQHNQANVGVYADVIAGGTLRRGDAVAVS